MLQGSIVAIITPFKNGRVDTETLGSLIEYQIKNGTAGIVPCGTTGESATLSHDEHKEVISFTIQQVKGRVPVIAGTGSNSTAEAIDFARFAKEAGADAHLSIAPYYNKPTQEGLYQHFKAIAEAVPLPMVLYNVPGRCAVNMAPETIGKLSNLPHIAGVKEATGDMKQAAEIMENVKSGFAVLSGDDFTNLPLLALGGTGAISVTANIAPSRCASVFTEWNKGNLKEALKNHLGLMPLHRAMFIETNPIPVKTAAYMAGLIPALEFRLPLCPMSGANTEKLKAALNAAGIQVRS